MRQRMITLLYKKEVLDFFRDKKTVFSTIFLPVILYPAIFLIVLFITAGVALNQEEAVYTVGLLTERAGAGGEEVPAGTSLEEFSAWAGTKENKSGYTFSFTTGGRADLGRALENGKIDAWIGPGKAGKDQKAGGSGKAGEGDHTMGGNKSSQVVYEIHYLSGRADSEAAFDHIKTAFEYYNEDLASDRVRAEGLDPKAVLHPIRAEKKDHSSGGSSLGRLLSGVLPLILIIGVCVGAMTPAIDTTAGEKERGTLETLMTAPVSGQEILTGKFLSVATIAVISVFMNVLSMGLIGLILYLGLDRLGRLPSGLSLSAFLPAVLLIIPVVTAFALFLSALLMSIGCLAKSYKEAGNYASPILIIAMLAAYVCFIPSITLTGGWLFVPIANVSLLLRDLISLSFDPIALLLVLFSNILYAFLSAWLLGKTYTSERLLFR